jgi:hypothetical protein
VTLTLDILNRESARAFIIEQLRCIDVDGAVDQAMMAEALRSAVAGELTTAVCDRRALLFVALNARWRTDLVLGRQPMEPQTDMQARIRLIDDLVAAGDISLDGNASFLPAPLRLVRLAQDDYLLAGCTPTSHLISEMPTIRSAGYMRITNGEGADQLPLLSMDDWLGAPEHTRHHSSWLTRFERSIAPQLRAIPAGDPERWQALTRANTGRYRFGPLPASPPGALTLCRHDADGAFAHVRDWVVRLERRDAGVRPTFGVEIDRSTSLRFRFAIQARDGVPARAQLFRSTSYIRLRYTWRFPDPESKIIHAGTLLRNERIPDLIFRSEFEPILRNLYTTLGVELEDHDAH